MKVLVPKFALDELLRHTLLREDEAEGMLSGSRSGAGARIQPTGRIYSGYAGLQ